VKELGRTNRKDNVAERILRYWQRLWEMDGIKTAQFRERKHLAEKIKQELD
jgi:hypothetical protein